MSPGSRLGETGSGHFHSPAAPEQVVDPFAYSELGQAAVGGADGPNVTHFEN